MVHQSSLLLIVNKSENVRICDHSALIFIFSSTVSGMTVAKVEKFGALFLSHIRHFCLSHGLPCSEVSTINY